MSRIVFLLEEYSMKVLLDELLPRLFPELPFLCVPHEGKQDLEKSVPRKLRAWREPGVRFVVLRDNDGGDCRLLKDRLVALCQNDQHQDILVRISCQELEAWYLGDLAALSEAFDKQELKKLASKARYRDPDSVIRPSTLIKELVPEFQKVSGARRLAKLLSLDNNRSRSYQSLMVGITRLSTILNTAHNEGDN